LTHSSCTPLRTTVVAHLTKIRSYARDSSDQKSFSRYGGVVDDLYFGYLMPILLSRVAF
jgi:hypothetical protein